MINPYGSDFREVRQSFQMAVCFGFDAVSHSIELYPPALFFHRPSASYAPAISFLAWSPATDMRGLRLITQPFSQVLSKLFTTKSNSMLSKSTVPITMRGFSVCRYWFSWIYLLLRRDRRLYCCRVPSTPRLRPVPDGYEKC